MNVKIKKTVKYLIALFFLLCALGVFPARVQASDGAIQVDGLKYEFEKNGKYELEKSEGKKIFNGENTYGTFSVAGKIESIDSINDVAVYGISEGVLTFTYAYTDRYLNAPEEEWHLVSDSGKKINGNKIAEKIQNGAIYIQTSLDGEKWVDTFLITNLFENIPNLTKEFYTTTDVQLKNGCYYRVYVVYELCKKTGKKNEYKKYAEVYNFYAYDMNEVIRAEQSKNDLKHCFSEKIKTGLDNGYSDEKEIDKKDPHFGWNLGEFYVKGYTRETTDDNGNPVFLENTGDEVVLYFDLLQDIDALNGDESLSISKDDKGYDKYFEMEQTYMGRGTLIVRYTDWENKVHDPVIYTDYLSAKLSPGADTEVKLYGEGDYEVSLDYEIKQDNKVLMFPAYTDYKIFFKFSIRNGKCMVYPLDAVTGSEISGSSYTENGFVLDLAYSRYLDLNVKREVMNEAGNLEEDGFFNDLAKNGSTFTEEGLYTITASNRYTGQSITKKIYVGTDPLLRATAKSGLDVDDVRRLVERGATIDQYGNIDLSNVEEEDISRILNESNKTADEPKEETGDESFLKFTRGQIVLTAVVLIPIVGIIVLVTLIMLVVIISLAVSNRKKKKMIKKLREQVNEYEKKESNYKN